MTWEVGDVGSEVFGAHGRETGESEGAKGLRDRVRKVESRDGGRMVLD